MDIVRDLSISFSNFEKYRYMRGEIIIQPFYSLPNGSILEICNGDIFRIRWPSFGKSKTRQKITKCLSNVKIL